MNAPENIAATLAIRVLDAEREHPIKAFFQFWPNRVLVEKLADTFLEKDDLPIKPYMPHVVSVIVSHFLKVSTESSPIEQEVIKWIGERGRIHALLLKGMASYIGLPP